MITWTWEQTLNRTIIYRNNYEILSGSLISNLNNYVILSGSSISLLDHFNSSISVLDHFKGLIGTSVETCRIRDNYLQNKIYSIVISGISAGNVEILYDASIAVLDTKIGNQLGITNTILSNLLISHGSPIANLTTNKADAFLYGSSIANLVNADTTVNSNLDILFQNDQSLSNAKNALEITVGTSSTSLDSEINSIYNYFVG